MSQRIGGICRDGTYTSATGRGAGSHHGGIAQWLYAPSSSSSSSSTRSSYSSSYSGSSYSSWGGGYSGYDSGFSYSSSSKSKSDSSFFGFIWSAIKNIFIFLLILIWLPFYLAYKLIEFLYGILKPLVVNIFKILVILISWILMLLYKPISFLFKNRRSIYKVGKIVFNRIYSLLVFALKRSIGFIKTQNKNGWPMFKQTKTTE